MIRWCVATALRFCAASVELRLSRLTNSLSANHGEEPVRAQTNPAPKAHASTRVDKPASSAAAAGQRALDPRCPGCDPPPCDALRIRYLLPAFLAGTVAAGLQTIPHHHRHSVLSWPEV